MKHYKDANNNIFGFEDGDSIPEGLTEISMEEVTAINEAKAKASFDALPYTQKRFMSYPSIPEQLDMLYWDGINGTTNWASSIAAVKTAYPKP